MSQFYVDGPAYIYVGTARNGGGYGSLLTVPRVYFSGSGGRGGFGVVSAVDAITGRVASISVLDAGSGFTDGSAIAVGTGKGGVSDLSVSSGAVVGALPMGTSENYAFVAGNRFVFEFLGMAERGLEVQFASQADEGYGTDAGHGVPGEAFYLGLSATVHCVLKRFNYAVYERAIAPSPKAQSFLFGRGAWSAAIGASLKDDGLTFPLVIWTPSATRKSAAYGSLAGGLHFVHAYVPACTETFGVRAKRIPMTFRCIPHVDERANLGLLYTPGVPTAVLPDPN